jgi:hypothetical protein
LRVTLIIRGVEEIRQGDRGLQRVIRGKAKIKRDTKKEQRDRERERERERERL